jgi:hypothetical protein
MDMHHTELQDDWERQFRFSTGYVTSECKDADWKRHHDTIKQLFLPRVNGQTRTLTDVRRIMATQHNFYARYIALLDKKKSHVANNDRLPSEAQYKKKLMTKKSKWKVEKNIPKAKMVAMHRIEDRRRLLEGKETNFTFHGQPVHKEKIERSRKRFRQSDGQEFEPLSPLPGIL